MTAADKYAQHPLLKPPSFEFDGMDITNPTASECSRFPVNPTHYGFEHVSTGGGCTALAKELPDGNRILLTDLMGASANLGVPGEKFLLGLFDKDATPLGCWELTNGVVLTDDDEQPRNQYLGLPGYPYLDDYKAPEAAATEEEDYDVRDFLSTSFGDESAAKWVELLAEEVLNCPVVSAVGEDATEVITAAQGLINMMADITESERKDIRLAVAHQCRVFYFG